MVSVNSAFTLSFDPYLLTITWSGNPRAPAVINTASGVDITFPSYDQAIVRFGGVGLADDGEVEVLVRCTACTNGTFITGGQLRDYVLANLEVPSASTAGAITATTPIVATPTVVSGLTNYALTHAAAGTSGVYANPTSLTTNATGHVTSVTAGFPQLMFRAMLVNPSTFSPTASPEVFRFSNYINPSGYFDQSKEHFTPPANGYYLSCINYQLLDMSFPLTDPESGFSNKFSVYIRRVGTSEILQIITSYPKVTQLCGSNTAILSLFSNYQYEMVFRYYTWNEVDQNPTGLYTFSSKQGFSNADNGTSWAIMKLL